MYVHTYHAYIQHTSQLAMRIRIQSAKYGRHCFGEVEIQVRVLSIVQIGFGETLLAVNDTRRFDLRTFTPLVITRYAVHLVSK